jgi:hypothetical protein
MIKQVSISFDKINDEYIIMINKNNYWYKYEIICSISDKKNKILKSKDMILIPDKIKSNILNKIDFKDNIKIKKQLEKYLENNKNKYKYIDIISEIKEDYIIYYGLTKIIKT